MQSEPWEYKAKDFIWREDARGYTYIHKRLGSLWQVTSTRWEVEDEYSCHGLKVLSEISEEDYDSILSEVRGLTDVHGFGDGMRKIEGFVKKWWRYYQRLLEEKYERLG